MDKLTRKKPTNIEELKKIAAGYIDMEEITASKVSHFRPSLGFGHTKEEKRAK